MPEVGSGLHNAKLLRPGPRAVNRSGSILLQSLFLETERRVSGLDSRSLQGVSQGAMDAANIAMALRHDLTKAGRGIRKHPFRVKPLHQQ